MNMAINDLNSLVRIFGRFSPGAEIQNKNYKEILLITLAQASIVDANIHPLEIAKIQQIMRRETAQEFTEAEIRRASRSTTYASASLDKYLRRAQGNLNSENKITILQAIVDVIKSDAEVNVLEIDYYNQAVSALQLTPAEQAGLTA